MPPQQIFIVRHGERADNKDAHLSRRSPRPHDPPLTDSGVAMSDQLGQFLGCSCRVDPSQTVVLTSPLLRCVQTADALVNGLLHTAAPDEVDSVPIYLESALVEGAHWMFYSMQHNRSLFSPEKFHFPRPIFHDASYFHSTVSSRVQITKPFDLNVHPDFRFDAYTMTESNFVDRNMRGADALLTESAFDDKTVILVSHGEVIRIWYEALSGYTRQLPSPPYTAVACLMRSPEGRFVARWYPPFTTPHLPRPPSEY